MEPAGIPALYRCARIGLASRSASNLVLTYESLRNGGCDLRGRSAARVPLRFPAEEGTFDLQPPILGASRSASIAMVCTLFYIFVGGCDLRMSFMAETHMQFKAPAHGTRCTLMIGIASRSASRTRSALLPLFWWLRSPGQRYNSMQYFVAKTGGINWDQIQNYRNYDLRVAFGFISGLLCTVFRIWWLRSPSPHLSFVTYTAANGSLGIYPSGWQTGDVPMVANRHRVAFGFNRQTE